MDHLCVPADLLHEFMDHMHSAQSRLSALCTCVEEYVEKMIFLTELAALAKVMDAACAQVGYRWCCVESCCLQKPGTQCSLAECEQPAPVMQLLLSGAFTVNWAAVCSPQVHALYALLDDYKIKVPDVDRAGYASLDSTYAGLKALMEEVEGGKEESIAKYSAGLETGEF